MALMIFYNVMGTTT